MIEIRQKQIVKKTPIQQTEPEYIGHFPGGHIVPMYAYRDKVYLHRLNVNCESDFTSNCDHESILVEMDLKKLVFIKSYLFITVQSTIQTLSHQVF